MSERGNGAAAPAGYTATQAPSYRDVQCESCHGPGFEHVGAPGVTPFPLAKVAAEIDADAGTCGDCHAGSHHPFVEEWAQSRHAEALATPATRADCNYCHEARAVLKAWNAQSHYVESEDVVTAANAIGITCAVCHDPLGSPNPANLRWPLETRDPSQNLCMRWKIAAQFLIAQFESRNPSLVEMKRGILSHKNEKLLHKVCDDALLMVS